jgi:hypothetical protein
VDSRQLRTITFIVIATDNSVLQAGRLPTVKTCAINAVQPEREVAVLSFNLLR